MAFSILNAEQRGGVGPNGKPSLTIDESAVRLTREGLSWSAGLGQSAVVTYAFRAAPPAQMPEGTGGFERLTSQQIQKVEEALDLWSAVANITFVRVGDGTFGEQAYSNNAAILFGYYNTGPEGVSAFAFFPGSQSPSSSAGDVWVNGSFLDNYYPTNQNDEGFATLVHEIGHAIGLSHPSDYDAGNGALTYAQNADHYEDSELYSIMSYFPPTAIGGSIPAGMAAPAGPQLDDIAAVQRLYGANTQTKLGDTVYGYIYGIAGERPEQTLRTSGDGGVWGTIWDAGGNDTLDFRSSPAGQKLDLQAGHFSDVHGNIGSLAIAQGVVVENAVGGVYDDLIIGNDVANVLSGLEGADTLQGGGGDDRLLGGPGGDRLDGGGGFDTADYSDAIGAVSIRLGVTGAQGADADSLVSIEALIGSAYGDVLDGDAGSNRLSGGDGDDVLDGGSGFDRLEGGQGNDIFFIDSASDTAVEVVGQGFDQLYTSVSYSLAAGSSVDYLSTSLQVGTAAIDLTGNELNNQIFGNNGSNVLNGAAGVDFMRGFGGDDVYFVDSTSDSTIEAVGGGFDQVYTSVSLALSAGTSIDYLSTTLQVGTGAINLTGNELDNQIFGNDGANVLRGEGGVDFMRGFGGNDIYFVDNTSDSTIEAAGGGFDEVYTSVSLALSAGTSIDYLSTTLQVGTSAINLTGNELDNQIFGNDGANVIRGEGGVDYMRGFAGDDLYFVDNVADSVIETSGQGFDQVYASASFGLSAGSSIEYLATSLQVGTAAINLTGNELNNQIFGNNGANVLNGGAGVDFVRGFAGDDIYFVDTAADSVIETSGEGFDIVYATASFQLSAGTSVEYLSTALHAGTTAIDLTGNELANEVYGNYGVNSLDGKGGNDQLMGFIGADTFAFTTALDAAGNVDRIVDFETASDTIALDDAIFAGLGLGALSAGAFHAGATAADADDRILYDQASGALLFDADGAGGAAAVQFATLLNTPADLSATNFVVV